MGDIEVCGEQVVECLRLMLENAIDACDDARKVQLRVEPESSMNDRFVRFVVCDQGPGIPSGELSVLFEPFYTTKARRLGIGLAAVQAMAVHNGGTVEARSNPNDTQFILRFRVAGPEEDEEPGKDRD